MFSCRLDSFFVQLRCCGVSEPHPECLPIVSNGLCTEYARSAPATTTDCALGKCVVQLDLCDVVVSFSSMLSSGQRAKLDPSQFSINLRIMIFVIIIINGSHSKSFIWYLHQHYFHVKDQTNKQYNGHKIAVVVAMTCIIPCGSDRGLMLTYTAIFSHLNMEFSSWTLRYILFRTFPKVVGISCGRAEAANGWGRGVGFALVLGRRRVLGPPKPWVDLYVTL